MPAEKSLARLARQNPTQLGDPVSLKAETSDTQPTDQDRGAGKSDDGKSLKERAEESLKKNPSALGDPVSLKAETTDKDPVDHDNGPSEGKEGKSKL